MAKLAGRDFGFGLTWSEPSDGLAKAPYIRESRRIQAEFTVLEQHVGTDARRQRAENSGCSGRVFRR